MVSVVFQQEINCLTNELCIKPREDWPSFKSKNQKIPVPFRVYREFDSINSRLEEFPENPKRQQFYHKKPFALGYYI